MKGAHDAFYVVNLNQVRNKYVEWCRELPRVHPFYAVKCNPDEKILTTLANLGCHFDCASQAEMKAVFRAGASPERIIYANPCKQISHLQWAHHHKVHTMTFDNAEELNKIQMIDPNANLLLRILVDDSSAQCPLGQKFGASLDSVPQLLRDAMALHLNVTGISFHVGSGCRDAKAYADAVQLARQAFDIAYDLHQPLSVLDIGGGFPGNDATSHVSFHSIAQALNHALDRYFPASSGVDIIAEPGRFFAASSQTLATNVIGRKMLPISSSFGTTTSSLSSPGFSTRQIQTTTRVPSFMYYVNDGLYGSFNCIMYDHAQVSARALDVVPGTPEYRSSIWGPTCDGLDCILRDVSLPQLGVGDWIYFPDMGAYTSAASSHFNGFTPPEKCYVQQDNDDVHDEFDDEYDDDDDEEEQEQEEMC